jgi:Domain of unknown function (DUF4224)
MSDLLSYDDLCQVTGAKRPSKQKQVLEASGVSYIVRLDGRVSVTWYSVNHAHSQGMITQDSNGFDLGALSGS